MKHPGYLCPFTTTVQSDSIEITNRPWRLLLTRTSGVVSPWAKAPTIHIVTAQPAPIGSVNLDAFSLGACADGRAILFEPLLDRRRRLLLERVYDLLRADNR